MNTNTVKLIKYGLISLLILGLLIATGWFGYNYNSKSKENTELRKKIELIDSIYKVDSIKYNHRIDSLNIIVKKQDSIIQAKLDGIKWIQDKYNKERAKIRAYDADSTLQFFKGQSEISNDW